MEWIWFLIYVLSFGFLSSLAVKEKNRNQLNWFLIGFFLGIFGLIASLIIKKQQIKKTGFSSNNYEKKCPDCAEMIKLEAKICRFCGNKFSEEEIQKAINNEKDVFNNSPIYKKGSYIKICPKCKTLSPSDFEECRVCGTNINFGRNVCEICGVPTSLNYGSHFGLICKECAKNEKEFAQ